jgi:hypothetical protein
LLLFLEYMPVDTGHWIRYFFTTLLVGHPYVHAILVAITSRNAGTVRTRTVASALYNMLVQASSIISQNACSSFPPHQLGSYHIIKSEHRLTIWSRFIVMMIDRFIDGATRFSSLFVFTMLCSLLELKYFTLVWICKYCSGTIPLQQNLVSRTTAFSIQLPTLGT